MRKSKKDVEKEAVNLTKRSSCLLGTCKGLSINDTRIIRFWRDAQKIIVLISWVSKSGLP